MERAIAELCPADAVQFRRFLEDNRNKFRQFKPCLERPFLGWRDVFSKRMLKLLPTLRPWLSLDQELGRYFSDPRIRTGFFVSIEVPGDVALPLPESLFDPVVPGVRARGLSPDRRVRGGDGVHGPHRPRDGRRNPARTRRPRRFSLRVAGRSGFAREGEIHDADALVINADFARAMTRLVPDGLRRRWTDRRIARKRFSCSTFMLYLGIEGATTTWAITPSTSMRTTPGTCARSKIDMSFPNRHPFTCKTLASPTPRSPRPA